VPVHDWTRVEDGIFHDFHTVGIGQIRTALNEGLLPRGYYALAEQHASRAITDVLTLHGQTIEQAALARRRSLAVRHVSGHRLVALLEIVSPANKDRAAHVEEFAAKVVSALDLGVHVLRVDLFPPARRDPQGMHGVIRQRLEQSDEIYHLPAEEPLTLASYVAGPSVEVYLEHVAVGAALPEMPLFLRPDRYINVPLEVTYQAAYHGVPAFWRNVLEGIDQEDGQMEQ
jgi:hypothetical protein